MSHTATNALAPLLTPQGHLRLVPDSDAPPLPAALHDRLAAAFAPCHLLWPGGAISRFVI